MNRDVTENASASWQSGLYARVDLLATPLADIDEATRLRAALVMIDDLAAMAAAAHEPEVLALSESSIRTAPGTESLQVTGTRSARSWTALVNAIAANWNELDEGYRLATCHGGLYSLPSVMAEVQATGGSIHDVYRGLIVGYEVVTAFARLFPAPRPLALHPHASIAPIGAAAGIATIRGSRGPGVEAAVNVAATLGAIGPFTHATDGKLVRNAWAGNGALSGFNAVEFAQAGIRGDGNSPINVLGDVLDYPMSESELSNNWDRWAIHDGYHKSYACCQYAHSAVEAAAELARGPLLNSDIRDIREIVIETHPLAMPLDDLSPTTVLGAKFSVPHVVAAVLSTQSTEAPTFSDKLIHDIEVDRLRRVVRMRDYAGTLEPPHDRPARVHVMLHDGRSFSAECMSAIGGPDRPMNVDQVLEKVELLTSPRMPEFVGLARDLVEGRSDLERPFGDFLSEIWTTA